MGTQDDRQPRHQANGTRHSPCERYDTPGHCPRRPGDVNTTWQANARTVQHPYHIQNTKRAHAATCTSIQWGMPMCADACNAQRSPPLACGARHLCHTMQTVTADHVNDIRHRLTRCQIVPGDVSTTRRANAPIIQHPSTPASHYCSTSATACCHLPTRRSHWHTSVHHARANDTHAASFNIRQHLQHTVASNGRHIQCPLAPANTSQRIRNRSMLVAYNADGAPRCPLRPTRAHVLVHQESSGNDSTFKMHA